MFGVLEGVEVTMKEQSEKNIWFLATGSGGRTVSERAWERRKRGSSQR